MRIRRLLLIFAVTTALVPSLRACRSAGLFKLDETDNLLNATIGYRAQLAVTPSHTEWLGDNGENAARSRGSNRE